MTLPQQQPYGQIRPPAGEPPRRTGPWLGIAAIAIITTGVLVTGLAWPGWMIGRKPVVSRPIPAAASPGPAAAPNAPSSVSPTTPSTAPDADPQIVAATYVQAINERDIQKEVATLCQKPPPADIQKAEQDLQSQRPTAKLAAPIQVSGDTATGSLVSEYQNNGRTLSYPASFTMTNHGGHWCITP